jgi:hypothetical protein
MGGVGAQGAWERRVRRVALVVDVGGHPSRAPADLDRRDVLIADLGAAPPTAHQRSLQSIEEVVELYHAGGAAHLRRLTEVRRLGKGQARGR